MKPWKLVSILSVTLLGCKDPTSDNGGNPPPLGNVLAISAGGAHTCALRLDGKAFCWGRNSSGELGDGTLEDRLNPVAVTGGLSFESISSGDTHTCGVTHSGEGYCWGDNVQGQVGGNASADIGLPPTLVAPGMSWAMISAGQDHSCGVTTGGDAYCWGTGYLGDNNTTRRAFPIKVPGGPWTEVSAATNYTCGLQAAGGAYCWGTNAGGLLGNGTTSGQSFSPMAVVGNHDFATLDAGVNHACGATTIGQIFCWGTNANAQLGTGATGSPTGTPVQAGITENLTVVASGEDFTCGAADQGTFCWGRNDVGQLGVNGTGVQATPVRVDASTITVSAFRVHACGISANFDAYCWGNNAFGQVGNGRTGAAVNLPSKLTLPTQ
ncbi:MAG TPA: hypothetical protein VJ867_13455 [Gemmatimonadaceae bacterium]|nr:hypothetical protein [Gemmatimonadaceae bacterium]